MSQRLDIKISYEVQTYSEKYIQLMVNGYVPSIKTPGEVYFYIIFVTRKRYKGKTKLVSVERTE